MRITTSIITKTATVLACGAAALSLSACGFEISFSDPSLGQDGQEQSENQGQQNDGQQTGEDTGATDPGSDTGNETGAEDTGSGGTGSGTDSGGDTGSDTSAGSGTDTSAGSDAGSGTDTSAGDDPIIKGSQLEASIKKQAEEQSGISGITVECQDLRASYIGATTTCTMDVPGDRKYFPLAKVTSIDGNYVEYKLEFPGVDF